ncbi:MAG: cache domain-containing protein [Chloroflexi bacterium]|nr:cache domain-containing protein [Chloroflexota bacterium]
MRASETSQDGDRIGRTMFVRFPRVPRLRRSGDAGGVPPPAGGDADRPVGTRRRFATPAVIAVTCMAIAVGFMAVLTYVAAQAFTHRAVSERAANEATTFSQHSARLATGDAFDGYIQMLRFADDPVVAGRASGLEARRAALQQLLYLNVNRFSSLTIADRAGIVLASTDPTLVSLGESQALTATRANLGPANSDIVLPVPGKPGYVEYSAPLKEADGAVWGILVGRADPARLWAGSLSAAVDGSRNVIINNDGQFAAGVPDGLLGQPWRGSAVGNGGIRANIAGVDSICGLTGIGKDTQIDRGLNVASCLPMSVVAGENGAALGKQALVTLAGAVLAIIAAAGLMLAGMRLTARRASRPDQAGPAGQEGEEETPRAVADAPTDEIGAVASDTPQGLHATTEPETAIAAVAATPVRVVVADVDALTLIDAYEDRNARLADRLRASVQARLLVVSAQADEAFRRAGEEEYDATPLHRRAMGELELIRDGELRSLGQELHPGLTRLGLPAAFRTLQKSLGDTFQLSLEVDADADSVEAADGRSPLSSGVRLTLYRLVRAAIDAAEAGGHAEAHLQLKRTPEEVTLRVSWPSETPDAPAPARAPCLAVEAHGGRVRCGASDGGSYVEASVPVAAVGVPRGDTAKDDLTEVLDGVLAPPQLTTFTLPEDDDHGSAPDDGQRPLVRSLASPPMPEEPALLADALVRIVETHADAPAIAVDIDLPDSGESLPPAVRKALLALVDASARALGDAGAKRATVAIAGDASAVRLSLAAETDGRLIDADLVREHAFAFDAFGGYVSVAQAAAIVSITAEAALGSDANAA